LTGGHQENERRAGTEPVALIAGMAAALDAWQRHQSERTRRMNVARDRLEAGLIERCAPVVVHGRGFERLPNTAGVAFPGLEGEALLIALDLEGVQCSLGSTCASGSAEPAPILLAMGVPPELALSTVRFSLSFESELAEIDDAVRRIGEVVERLRRASRRVGPPLGEAMQPP
jgi:cysteine desulfurase